MSSWYIGFSVELVTRVFVSSIKLHKNLWSIVSWKNLPSIKRIWELSSISTSFCRVYKAYTYRVSLTEFGSGLDFIEYQISSISKVFCRVSIILILVEYQHTFIEYHIFGLVEYGSFLRLPSFSWNQFYRVSWHKVYRVSHTP